MNNNVKPSEIIRAIYQYEKGCNNLADTLNKHLFGGSKEKYWIDNEVGGVCDFGGSDFLSPADMVLILEHDTTYDEYSEWRDANFGNHYKDYVNLKSWLMGCRHEMLNNKPKAK